MDKIQYFLYTGEATAIVGSYSAYDKFWNGCLLQQESLSGLLSVDLSEW